jgi:hypothetical protein
MGRTKNSAKASKNNGKQNDGQTENNALKGHKGRIGVSSPIKFNHMLSMKVFDLLGEYQGIKWESPKSFKSM